MEKNNKLVMWGIIIIFIGFIMMISSNKNDVKERANTFKILASTSMKSMGEEITKYTKNEGFNTTIEYHGDLEIVDILNNSSLDYDAVWISNSIWLYMLNNSNLITDSKSIAIDPVVLGVTKSMAKELGFIDKDVYNKDILKTIKDGKLKYVMASVTKTNTGATTYLSFLNSLAGSPEVLTEDMIKDEKLGNDLKNFFKGVERVSGDDEYLISMFLNGDYDAIYSYESSLIDLNKELISNGKEPLYLIYPTDGVAINDMPFAYINNKDNDKKEKFKLIQSYLRSDEAIKKMEGYGYRSWYGGVKKDTDSNVFNPEWGIDTSKYLKDMKYPSKKVITEALNLYIEKLRKPTHVVFCLDVSGSMYGTGLSELKDAMNYILDYDKASKEQLQFSSNDKVTIITFNHEIVDVYKTVNGDDTAKLIDIVNKLKANGATNIYDPSIKALEILKDEDSNEYTKTIILMTDGESNTGDIKDLRKYYRDNKLDIPIYSITFGDSSEYELGKVASLTNSKIFDGKSGLREAFALVRSYN